MTSHHHPQPLRKQNLQANNCTTQHACEPLVCCHSNNPCRADKFIHASVLTYSHFYWWHCRENKVYYMTFKGIIIHWRLDKTLMCKPNLEKSELHPFDPSEIIFPSSLFPPSRAISSCRISSSKSRFLGFVSGGGTGAKVLGNVNFASLPSKIWQDDRIKGGSMDQRRVAECDWNKWSTSSQA